MLQLLVYQIFDIDFLLILTFLVDCVLSTTGNCDTAIATIPDIVMYLIKDIDIVSENDTGNCV